MNRLVEFLGKYIAILIAANVVVILSIFDVEPTIIIAGIVACVAILQYQTNKAIASRQLKLDADRLKLEVFEKRFKVYMYLRNFVESAYRSGDVDQDESYTVSANIGACSFLFGNDVVKFGEKFLPYFGEFAIIKDAVERHDKIKFYSLDMLKDLIRLFKPYMDLGKL